MAQSLITLPLRNLPNDVNDIIKNEQLRMALFDRKNLKKEQVVFHIVRQWYQYKNLVNQPILENENK